MGQSRRSCVALLVLQLSGCSFYGSETYLVPESGVSWRVDGKVARASCANTELKTFAFTAERAILVYALLWVPYFPPFVDVFGPPSVHVSQLRPHTVTHSCSVDDVSLISLETGVRVQPERVWQSRVVPRDEGDFQTCEYSFGPKIAEFGDVSLELSSRVWGCELRPLTLKRVEEGFRYHDVPIQ